MKVDRLVSIIMILLERKRIGAQELADMFEVSPRTIYRDIDAINMAGIPICSTTGVGGGFEIMQQYKVDKKIFTESDLSAIIMGLSNLSSIMRRDELVNALAKVKSFIPEDKAKDIDLRANQIYIDTSPWIGNKNIQPYLDTIKNALQESRLLSFGYIAHSGRITERTIEPYQLLLKSSHWYLQGYCLMRNDFRLFKLSRMSALKLTDDVFTPREYENPLLNVTDIADATQITIKLRIHKSIMDTVLDYCACDCFTPDGDEHYIVDFPFVKKDYYYNLLIGFGDKCECIAPPEIRKELKPRINAIAALYAEKQNTCM